MGMRRPNQRIEWAGVGRCNSGELAARLSGGQAPALRSPLTTPLDSGFRRNDEVRIREVLSCQSETVPGLESILSRDRL